MIAISMTMLLVGGRALLFVLQVCHSLIDHVALLPVDHAALLLALED